MGDSTKREVAPPIDAKMKSSAFTSAATIALLTALTAGWSLANPALRINPGTEVSWTTTIGNTYQLQASTHPSGPWTDLGTEEPGDGTETTYYHPVPNGAFHYQVLETVPGTPPIPPNPVNGGFELGSGTTADHWTASGGQPPTRTDSDAYTGTYAMRCAITSAPAEGLLDQFIVAEGGGIVAGQSYDFSFRAKQISFGPSYIQEYEVQWLNASNAVIGSSGVQGFNGGSGVWAEINLPAQVAPSNTVEARVRFRFVTGAVAGGHGEVLLDDIILDSGAGSGPGRGRGRGPSRALRRVGLRGRVGSVPHRGPGAHVSPPEHVAGLGLLGLGWRWPHRHAACHGTAPRPPSFAYRLC